MAGHHANDKDKATNDAPASVKVSAPPRDEAPRPATNAADQAATLTQVSFFAGLDAESLRELAGAVRRKIFRAGEVIFHRDDPGQVLYIIRSGRVKIFITSPEGQEVVLTLLRPGDYFGELALLDGQPRSASAVAMEATDTFALQRSDFIHAVERHPRIAIQVMNVLSRRLRQTDAMIEDLLFLDVHGRVAKKLLELAESHGVPAANGIRIEMRLTQGELAAMVGSSRESVNKVIGYFTDKQFISTDRYKITVLRLADLRRRVF
ncbi:MAG: Transcriptional regulator, Crp/Fnr family [Ktedonobacterales bacterium]|nr:MAG: Transcriptional regulator, Crp/Fnr family [Ktedonobacterales bacterium]